MTKNSYLYLLLSLLVLAFTEVKSQHVSQKDTIPYAITGTTDQKAIDAGMAMLKNGGSAMDAGLMVAMAQNVVNKGKATTFAGIMSLLYYEAKTGKIHNMNAGWNTVQNETSPLTIQPNPGFNYTVGFFDTTAYSGRTALVPGFMKGVGAAHRKFGKIPFRQLFEYPVSLAENGIEWEDQDSRDFEMNKHRLTIHPGTKSVFTKEDGSYYQTGDTFKQPELALTLRATAAQGVDYMYTGKWAEKFVKAVSDAGGKMTMKDLADYQVIWTEPVHTNYHGYDVYANGYPAHAGWALINDLNMAEAANLSKMGHYSKSPEALAAVYKICVNNLVQFTPENLLNYRNEDAAKSLNKDEFDKTLTKEYASKSWNTVQQWKFALKTEPAKPPAATPHTANVIAIDKEGNILALTHTINTVFWGTNGLFADGVSVSDAAIYQLDAINKTGPGNRLPDRLTPGLLFKDGKPALGFSGIGLELCNQNFSSLLNVMDFKMSPLEANTRYKVGYFDFINNVPVLKLDYGTISPKVITKATKLGAVFKEESVTGFWQGIAKDSKTGKLTSSEVTFKGNSSKLLDTNFVKANAIVLSEKKLKKLTGTYQGIGPDAIIHIYTKEGKIYYENKIFLAEIVPLKDGSFVFLGQKYVLIMKPIAKDYKKIYFPEEKNAIIRIGD